MQTDEKAAFALFRQMDRMRRAWHHLAPCNNLSKSDFGALMTILHGGKAPFVQHPSPTREKCITMSTLAAIMGQSLPAISQRISTLEQNGYVQRFASPDDRRVTLVQLTPAGEALLAKAHHQFSARLREAMGTMTPEENETFLRLLEKLTSAMEEIGKEEPTC